MKVPGGREASLLLGGTLGEQHAHRGEHTLPLARQLEAGLGDLLAEQRVELLAHLDHEGDLRGLHLELHPAVDREEPVALAPESSARRLERTAEEHQGEGGDGRAVAHVDLVRGRGRVDLVRRRVRVRVDLVTGRVRVDLVRVRVRVRVVYACVVLITS